jgi:tRNA pseudouridine55 synthase
MYSALKVNGRKLVDLAREGVVIERQAREIEIFELLAEPTDTPSDYLLTVTCSGGTYIRTLCADIGQQLGCGGAMATLVRLETERFSIDRAYTVAELEEMTEEERVACLIPTESLFDSLPSVSLPAFYEKLCRSGCEIYQKKIKCDYPLGQRVRLSTAQGNFFALGEVRDYPDGTAIKALKLFDLG